MKEFELPINELNKGLRPYQGSKRNTGFMDTLINAKCAQADLIPFEPITDRSIDVTVSHPFPQIFIGSVFRILATSTIIYDVNTSWAKTSKLTSLSTDDIWDFMDFGDYLVLLNGAVIVYYDVSGTAYTSMASSSTFPRFLTGTNFKGQLVGGNVKTSWHDCGTKSLVWSKIGDVDFTPDKQNTAGYWQNVWDGDIKRVMRLNDVVMVYCENGVVAAIPSGPTFGFKELSGVGIPVKGAAGGNELEQVFVDQKNFLWRVKGNGEVIKLGYQDYMANLTAANIVISYDPSEKEFYITDGVTSYLLTEWGLSEVWQAPTSVASIDGDSLGVYTDLSNVTFELITDILDFGVRGLKTVEFMELGIDDANTVQTAVAYRYAKGGSFADLAYQVNNNEGVSHIGASAEEFKLKVKSSNYTGINLDWIKVHYKFTDKRYTRGQRNVG